MLFENKNVTVTRLSIKQREGLVYGDFKGGFVDFQYRENWPSRRQRLSGFSASVWRQMASQHSGQHCVWEGSMSKNNWMS